MSGVRLGVVINPTSHGGRAAALGEQLLAQLLSRGHVVRDLSGPDAETALRRARQGVVEGLDALVVVGGDGSVNLGVNVVAGTTLPLGIVAAGSGNDLARTLDLPLHDVPAAVRVIEAGLEHGPRQVDAVTVQPPQHSTRRWFAAVLSAGLDAAVNARANAMRWPRGRTRYVRAVAAELGRFRPYGYRLTLDDGTVWESAGTLVAVANAPQFGGGIHIAPDAVIDDGLLDVVVAGPITRAGVARVFPGMYRGRHLRHPAVQVLRSRSVLIEPSHHGQPPPDAFADGEHIGPLPLRTEVRPGALAVLAPSR